jgi:transposase
VLVELNVVEQRYDAVKEVIAQGLTVTEVAVRYKVSRQTVHEWLARYRAGGFRALADRSHRPKSCPHQMDAEIEARVLDLRRAHPGWGPVRLRYTLERQGMEPVPGRSSIYRALVRAGLVEPRPRRRKRKNWRRWERANAMELWQMDVMGGPAGRRDLVQGGHRSRRPLPVLRDRPGGPQSHGHRDLRSLRRGHAPIRGAGGRAHRQRQGVHRSVRPPQRSGPLRPDLQGERHPTPPHLPGLTHHHGEDRAVPQEPPHRAPRRGKPNHPGGRPGRS